MNLDYLLVKSESVSHIAEILEDETYRLEDYRAVAESMLPQIFWQPDGAAFTEESGVSVEVRASAGAIHLFAR